MRSTHSTVVAYVALFAAIGGGAIAIGRAGGDDEIQACYVKKGNHRGEVGR